MASHTTKRVVLSGCSGGGKSTLLVELARHGYDVVEEPGRRIISEQRVNGGDALPWIDARAFVQRAMDVSARDIDEYPNPPHWVFFDRGFVDAASALSQITGARIESYLDTKPGYYRKVFLCPPWPEIYVTDSERQHSLSQAIDEFERLQEVYPAIGYDVVLIPKTSVATRAEFVLEQLAQ